MIVVSGQSGATYFACKSAICALATIALTGWLPVNVLAAEYGELTAQELIITADNALSTDKPALAERALELLLESKLGAANATTLKLIELAEPVLADLAEEKRKEFAKYLGDAPKIGNLSFEQLRARYALEAATREALNAPAELVEHWVNALGIEKLSVDELAWCLQQSLPNNLQRKEFSAIWSGQLTPPHSGEYTFSVSPININSLGREQVRHSISVTIAGQHVLETPAKPAEQQQEEPAARNRRLPPQFPEWKSQGDAILLEANKPVPIQVEMEYSCKEIAGHNPPSVILFWKGPGINRQVVPAKLLAGPEGKPHLQVEYRWPEGATERLVVQESDTIDFTVDGPASIVPQHPEFVEKLSKRLFELAISKQYLDQCASGKTQHVYLREEATLAGLSTADRMTFLEIVLSREELLTGLTAEHVVTLYERFRYGAEEKALDVVGLWMQGHADVTPEITLDFFRVNRQPYWELGQLLGGQLSKHVKLLQDRYLVLEDSRCVLPAAYTLSYATLAKDRTRPPVLDPEAKGPPSNAFQDWIELLSEELDNDKLIGDLRVNWLLARAQAEESRGSGDSASNTPPAHVWSGRDWLDEANLVAESQTQRLIKERLARWAFLRDWNRVEEETSDSQAPQAWRDQIAEAKAAAVRLIQQQQRNSDGAFMAELERRLALAERRQDEADANRYKQIIESIKVNAEQ